HGCASAATFARAFRARFGMSASEWRRGGAESRRRQGMRTADQRFRKPGKARDMRSRHSSSHTRKEDTMSVAVRTLPAYHVAYMRYVGPYGDRGIPELWRRLRQWMGTRGLDPVTTLRLGIGYDDAAITDPAKCSYDACAVVAADFAGDRWVSLRDVPAGRLAGASLPRDGGHHRGRLAAALRVLAPRQRLSARPSRRPRALSRRARSGVETGPGRLPLRALPPGEGAVSASAEMVAWQEFAAAEPDMAGIGRALLEQFGPGLAFLATVRSDGAPRLHPVCPVLTDGRLYVLVTRESPKRGDLERDGRYALQTFPQPKPGSDEFYVAGSARLVRDPATRAALLCAAKHKADASAVGFELGLRRVVHHRWAD